MADAGIQLAQSLDYATTMQKVARLVVADFAEWCFVDVVEGGRVRDVAVAHVDPVKEGLARTLVRRLPQLPTAPSGVARVLRTLEPEIQDGGESSRALGAHWAVEYPDALREIGARSYICAPLLARDRAIGAITYVRGSAMPSYVSEDLDLARELARRAAAAIENSILPKELADAVRDRDELIAFLSHDLRNLLGTIGISGDHLLRSVSGTEAQMVERIRRARFRCS